MAQRSYTNDRYRKNAKVGSTRKSAAKAKPIRKQGSVEVSSSSSKPKKTPNKDWSGLPTSPEIKKWRKVWWVLLLGGLAMIGIGFLVPELRENMVVQRFIAMAVLACSMVAVSIDIFVIRKLRKALMAEQAAKGKRRPAAEQAAKGKKKSSKGDADAASGGEDHS